MLNLTIGVDVGNNACKVWPEGLPPFSFPTFIDVVAQASIWESEMEPLEHLDVNILQSKPDLEGRGFYGYLATTSRNGKPMPVRSNKARSTQVLRTLLTALAVATAMKLDNMKVRERKALLTAQNGEPLPVNVYLGTGLPMDTWLQEEDRKAFRRNITGTHVVQFVTTPRWSTYGPFALNVQASVISPEGAAILYGAVFDEDGRLQDRALAQGTVLINDIGANTHDAPVYRQMKLDNILSRAYDSDLAGQLDEISRQIRLEFNRHLNRQQVAEALFENGMALPNGALPPISIRHLAEPRFRDLADQYAGRIIETLEKSNYRLTDVVMAGGGAAVVRGYLEDALEARGLHKPFPFRLHWLEHAQYGNAIGYLKLIKDYCRRKHIAAS